MERTNDMKSVYGQTKILICATPVDETFCRVVNEGMMNGIPILTTHKGNIHYLVDPQVSPVLVYDETDFSQWERQLTKLYGNADYYRMVSKRTRQKYRDTSS